MENNNLNLNVLVSYTLDKELNKQELLKYIVENYADKYKDLISPPEPNPAQGIVIAFGEQPILEIIGLLEVFNLKIFTKRIDILGQLKDKNSITKENIYPIYEILDNIILSMEVNPVRIGNVIFGNKIINTKDLYKLYSYFCKEEDLIEFSIRKTKRYEELYNLVLSLNIIEFPENINGELLPNKEKRKLELIIDSNTVPWKSKDIYINLDKHKEKVIELVIEEYNNLLKLGVLE